MNYKYEGSQSPASPAPEAPVSAEKHNELYKAVHGFGKVVEHLFHVHGGDPKSTPVQEAQAHLDAAKAALANAEPTK